MRTAHTLNQKAAEPAHLKIKRALLRHALALVEQMMLREKFFLRKASSKVYLHRSLVEKSRPIILATDKHDHTMA